MGNDIQQSEPLSFFRQDHLMDDGFVHAQWVACYHNRLILVITDLRSTSHTYTGHVLLYGSHVRIFLCTDSKTSQPSIFHDVYPQVNGEIGLREPDILSRSTPIFSTWEEARNHCFDLVNLYLNTMRNIPLIEEKDSTPRVDITEKENNPSGGHL